MLRGVPRDRFKEAPRWFAEAGRRFQEVSRNDAGVLYHPGTMFCVFPKRSWAGALLKYKILYVLGAQPLAAIWELWIL